MRIARFRDGEAIHTGTVDGDEIVTDTSTYDLSDVELLTPVDPSKIVAVGKNYENHIREMLGEDAPLPEFPLLFFLPPTSVVGLDDAIQYRRDVCSEVHYEGELGVVVGRRCSRVTEDEAMDYVMGYTCFNDVSERDWNRREEQWARAKGMDTFSPVGPYVQTDPPEEVRVQTRVNGETRQDARTNDMVFSVPELVAEISRFVTLKRGDIIATGTPSGVGEIGPGDEVEVEVESIGTLRNEIVGVE
jgi:2-keto-4-pentenoate hydratase/2-oxohepta-3-ene-1,7-dioic acid hydratase in catechol pathway